MIPGSTEGFQTCRDKHVAEFGTHESERRTVLDLDGRRSLALNISAVGLGRELVGSLLNDERSPFSDTSRQGGDIKPCSPRRAG